MKNTAYPVRSVNSTNTVEATFGSISRKATDQADSPRSVALVTKSSVTTDKAADRTVCTTIQVKKNAMTKIITTVFEPSTLSTIKMTIKLGRQRIISTTRIPIRSAQDRL